MIRGARVLLAERQPVIKNILLKALSESKFITIVESVETKVSLLHYLKQDVDLPDIILLDASLDVEENFTLTQFISQEFPEVKIIATIDAMDTLYIRRMIQSGIKGFVLKDSDISTVITAIAEVQHGKTFFSDSIINFNKADEMKKVENATEDDILNSVEKEILKLIVNKFSVKEISAELKLEMDEVNEIIKHITEKTKVTSTTGLQKYALSRMLF